ncbi:hypothetical protein LINGRAHAP2_LOCUS33814 [Linum grandiflorum]
MGSSYVLGGSSSRSGGGTESGWTNYIGSSIQNSSYIEFNGGYGSDDSMVSDASSGPTNQKKGGFSSRKGEKQRKKLGKQGSSKQRDESRIKDDDDDDAKSAASRTGSKVRKAK